jgi:L-2-hydroxyglutarate oxidase LhgO
LEWIFVCVALDLSFSHTSTFPVFQEYTIAVAENAVDNGIELKIRRQVINIQRQDDHLELTVNHWEPKPYVESLQRTPPFDITLIGTLGAGILSVILALSTGGELFEKLPVLVGIGLTLALYQMVNGAKRFTPTQKTTPLKDLVDKAGEIIGQGGQKMSVEDMKIGGSGSAKGVDGVSVGQETVRARFVINCAGSASDQIANMIGDHSFKIKPRLGDYLLLNRSQGHLARHTLFPCPDPVLGKGVLVQTTLWGNLILGPTARDVHKPEHSNMSAKDIQHYILSKCQELVPRFDAAETIHAFCGARAKSDRGDWIIENSSVDGRMIHVAGIDSPGLAGSPAIALEVVRLLEEAGCTLDKNPLFNPQRAPIITPKPAGMRGLKLGPVGKNDSDGINEEQMAMNVICKCEKVTELEVVRALRRSLPIDSTQAIRKRTRAGMGHCQGEPENYNCEARVKAIIARETGMSMNQVGGRPWPATSTLSQRWPDSKELSALEELKRN